MLIGGWQKLSLIDYPGKIAATLFTVGCNFRCGFCHNPELVLSPGFRTERITEEEIFDFLKSRQGLLEGAVISGGEPTLQNDLPKFVQKIKNLGFLMKIDTNGANPEMIEKLNQEKLVDFWAMDIKAPLEKYEVVAGTPVNLKDIKKSVELIKKSGVDYEFRATLIQRTHTAEDVLAMARLLEGANIFVLQKFVSRERLVNQDFVNQKSFSDEELKKIAEQCRPWVEKCEIR